MVKLLKDTSIEAFQQKDVGISTQRPPVCMQVAATGIEPVTQGL